jgi:pSer/pThr/pTyr-binding forkhead associated (FHA) protein
MAQAVYGLVVRQGPEPERKIELSVDEAIIGRDPSAAIAINSPLVSRRHVHMWKEGNTLWAEDLGSSNGTFLNAGPVESQVRLKSGDRPGLGRAVIDYPAAGCDHGVVDLA